jgi:hypothetical protein
LGTQDKALVMLELRAAWSAVGVADGRRRRFYLTGVMFGWGLLIKGFSDHPATIALSPALWVGGLINSTHWV